MASKPPVYGSSARTEEFTVDLVGEGIQTGPCPYSAGVVVSVDANHTLRVEVEAANELNWELDARIVDGSLEIVRAFNDGDGVPDDVIPNWVERVAGVVGERLEGDR
ncbi:hypothetical protein C467_07882 [Halorubrum hochstenium ATCC 700873]|uniref:Uncharacterized protein n=1 Tax=Halorubrum hochstenium ATCC 700873 TaxID=1227481 RepID=M0F9R3_9EURY|nr:hypothetical protein [Halorubrum hochstenium]ELZ56776.1 hypothetical protein C467_07882 [Halorubrum hochstenium ATCC 700873]